MANENNKLIELVSDDDDPTAELEIPVLRVDPESEADARTFDVDDYIDESGVRVSELQADLNIRQETISRLQFDIEQLRSKWGGLEAEISARESQTETLHAEVAGLHESINKKDKLIQRRDKRIRELKGEIREREQQHSALSEVCDELRGSLQKLIAENEAAENPYSSLQDLGKNGLIARLEQSEQYADSIRQQLQDLIGSSAGAEKERDELAVSLDEAATQIELLNEKVTANRAKNTALEQQLDAMEKKHVQEIRTLRFELGEAQNTIAESAEINTQLTSDLVYTRGSKDELARQLSNSNEESRVKIKDLKKAVKRLTQEAEDYEHKLTTKSEAITVLLAELAKKSEQLESIGEIEEVIHEIDDRITERIDPPAPAQSDRTTRLLVGKIDGQMLRFPLFKDRLTIGRTDDNDIQLSAAYVSRQHAVVQTDRDVTRIIDWGSKNGVYVNGERIKEHFLEQGDIVSIGNARFRFEERKKRDV